MVVFSCIDHKKDRPGVAHPLQKKAQRVGHPPEKAKNKKQLDWLGTPTRQVQKPNLGHPAQEKSPMRVVNHFNKKVYFVSLASVQRRIKVPTDVGFGIEFAPIELRIRLQAAVYEYKPNFFRQILSRPVLVVNLSDVGERVPDELFSELVRGMLENERVEDLFDEDRVCEIFDRRGFKSVSASIWSLFHFSRVRHAFVLKSRDD
jgi:hypothetical protein